MQHLANNYKHWKTLDDLKCKSLRLPSDNWSQDREGDPLPTKGTVTHSSIKDRLSFMMKMTSVGQGANVWYLILNNVSPQSPFLESYVPWRKICSLYNHLVTEQIQGKPFALLWPCASSATTELKDSTRQDTSSRCLWAHLPGRWWPGSLASFSSHVTTKSPSLFSFIIFLKTIGLKNS